MICYAPRDRMDLLMNEVLNQLLTKYQTDSEGVYLGTNGDTGNQVAEIRLREEVASREFDNHLDAVSGSHSIPVMDREVDRFLKKMPQGALILDIGGCWGWHWRRIASTRPDVRVLIVDFVRSNLTHAKQLLADLVGRQVWLMHADATTLPFQISEEFPGFDGVWTVQTFQHIPDFRQAVSEASRVLKCGGFFVNYSLNHQPPIAWLYKILGKRYVLQGQVEGAFWLARTSGDQKECIRSIIGPEVAERWTEYLYSPEFYFTSPGKVGSLLGRLDAFMSNNIGIFGCFARQRSFEGIKTALRNLSS
jgi:ubiquinone/menaquinone biosynthesis C-methylase UbiE